MANGYQGKISNAGAQIIQAPHSQRHSLKGNDVVKGNDLRTNKPGGKK